LLAVGPFETAGYQQEILALAQRLQINELIEWTGFEKNVNQRLRQIHVMVLPSLFGEGLPMVVLEAMACGLPVIASRVEGIPEAIRDGQDGLLCDPNSPESLAEKIEKLYRDTTTWQSMGVSAKKRHREHLSDVAMAEKIAGVYSGLSQN
jgi:glycosyltransferase involved in cell wall biosynthesis